MASRNYLRSVIHLFVLVCVGAVTAEFTARVDDWWFKDTPFWSKPAYDDLFMIDGDGQRRGKPDAHYQKWQMNSYGFRNAQISREPEDHTERVILLGASETFGLYESPGKEFAAQLAELTLPYGIEIVNAALPGITITTLTPYWKRWVSRFGASTVVIYPSTHLFVSCEDWSDAPTPVAPPVGRERIHLSDLRMFGRLMSLGLQPEFFVRWSGKRRTAQIVAQHPPSWVYTAPPEACLARLQKDLINLVDSIQGTGAQVIVCTQALRAARSPGPDDIEDLESFRVFSPRASARVIREFVTRANANIRTLGAVPDVRIVDVDGALGGHREAFGDLVHFNDDGAKVVASLIAQALVPRAAAATGTSR